MIWNENKDETVGIERIWLNDIGTERIEYIQIVRCKDCKHYQKFSTCNLIEGAKDDPNWFCADGERTAK